MGQIIYDIDNFMSYCECKNLSIKTMKSYEQTLRLFAQYMEREKRVIETENVKEKDVMDYIKFIKERGKYTVVTNINSKLINFPENREDYGKKIDNTTINNYLRNIKVFFNYLYSNRYIMSNPIVRIKQLRDSRIPVGYINDDNIKYLLKSFDLSKFHEYRDYIITQLIFDTGMRIGETLSIKEKDIDFIKMMILLPAENTKGKKDRYVFFSSELQKQLRRWFQYKDRYRNSEYVFCTNKGNKLKIGNYETNFKKYGERVGIKNGIHPHMLRNNFAKRFLMQGGDIYTLSRILGHSSVKVTEEAYLDLNESDLRKNYEKYSPLYNLK